jgi:hypothetical protein
MTTVECRADFIALVCADDELLRAEFEEIVAAGWGPPPRPVPGRGGDRGPDPAGPRPEPRRPAPARSEPGPEEWARQRSPPR